MPQEKSSKYQGLSINAQDKDVLVELEEKIGEEIPLAEDIMKIKIKNCEIYR